MTIEPASLQDQRHDTVARVLLRCGARSVLDLGCGAGDLLARLVEEPQFESIVGLDISPEALAEAERRVLEAHGAAGRLRLVHGSFATPAPHLVGFDAATLVEVIEHIDPGRLSPVERTVFADFRPRTVIVTTPNSEYNENYGLAEGEFRHPDHRFEWNRARFRSWARGVAGRHGYGVTMGAIGDVDFDLRRPTQLAVFSRSDA